MLYVLGAVTAVIALMIFKKSGCFFKSLVTSALGGVVALCAVGTLSHFVPLTVGINLYSLFFSSLFSVPGVVFMLLSKTFIF